MRAAGALHKTQGDSLPLSSLSLLPLPSCLPALPACCMEALLCMLLMQVWGLHGAGVQGMQERASQTLVQILHTLVRLRTSALIDFAIRTHVKTRTNATPRETVQTGPRETPHKPSVRSHGSADLPPPVPPPVRTPVRWHISRGSVRRLTGVRTVGGCAVGCEGVDVDEESIIQGNVETIQQMEEGQPMFSTEDAPKTQFNIGIDVQQHRAHVAKLNPKQRAFFDHIRSHTLNKLSQAKGAVPYPPLHVYLTGGAGTGESFLLRCCCDEIRIVMSKQPHAIADMEKVLVAAFMGKAAANVQGSTIHKAFHIRMTEHNASEHDGNTHPMEVRLQDEFKQLGCICFEEASMINQNLIVCASSRMNKALGVPRTQTSDHSSVPVFSVFGYLDVIFIGDFYQIQAMPDKPPIIDL